VDEQARPEVRIGGPVGDHIAIRVLGRAYPDADDFGDGNWLSTFIDFAVGQFSGTVAASRGASDDPKMPAALASERVTSASHSSMARAYLRPTIAVSASYTPSRSFSGQSSATLNGADEVLVSAFLDGALRLGDVPPLLAACLEAAPVVAADSLAAIERADHEARALAGELLARRGVHPPAGHGRA